MFRPDGEKGMGRIEFDKLWLIKIVFLRLFSSTQGNFLVVIPGVIASNIQRFFAAPQAQEKEALGLELEVLEDSATAMDALVRGEADYMIIGRYRAKVRALELDVDHLLSYTEIAEFSRVIYLGFSKDSQWEALIPALDARVKVYSESGYITHLHKKYLISWYKRKACQDQPPSKS